MVEFDPLRDHNHMALIIEMLEKRCWVITVKSLLLFGAQRDKDRIEGALASVMRPGVPPTVFKSHGETRLMALALAILEAARKDAK